MKKIIICLFSVFVLVTASFSETIGERWFEIKTDVSMGLFNSGLSINDIFQEEIVIDPRKFASQLPKKGLVTGLNVEPKFDINVNILNVHAGLHTGAQIYGQTYLSKSLFEFLGYGNELNEELVFKAGGDLDIFTYSELPVSFSVNKYTISVKPGIYIPVMHSAVKETQLSILNDEDGSFIVQGKYKVNVATSANSIYLENIYSPVINLNTFDNSAGFDLDLGLKVPLFLGLSVKGRTHIPLVPGKLYSEGDIEGGFSYKVNLLDESKSDKEIKFEKGDNFKVKDCNTYLHRPLELMIGAEWNPFANMLVLNADLGFGVKYPFSTEARTYAQYDLSCMVQALKIVGAKISSEYMNEMFKHELSVMLNCRVFELDLGVDLYGSDFLGSMSGKGYGGFLTFCFGF